MLVALPLLLALAAAPIVAPHASASPAEETISQLADRIDRLGDRMDVLEVDLANAAPAEAWVARGALASRLLHEAEALVAQLEPRVDAMRSRIAQLDRKSVKSPGVVELRSSARGSFEEADRLLRRVKVLRTRARQDAEVLGRRRRAL